jgi:hypothetical protein
VGQYPTSRRQEGISPVLSHTGSRRPRTKDLASQEAVAPGRSIPEMVFGQLQIHADTDPGLEDDTNQLLKERLDGIVQGH